MTRSNFMAAVQKVVNAKPRKAVRLFQNLIDMAGRTAQSTACRLGCSACCHTMPTVASAMEEQSILTFVAENTNGVRTYLKDKMRRLTEAESSARDIARLASGPVSFRDEWRALPDSRCPALAGRACVIYAARPIECALHYAFTECVIHDSLRDIYVPQVTHIFDYPPDGAVRVDVNVAHQINNGVIELENLCKKIDERRGLKGTRQPLSSVLLRCLGE